MFIKDFNSFVKNKINWLLYLFVFLLPWQMRWIVYDPRIKGGVWEYGRISIYGFDIVFILLVLCFFIFLFCHPERPRRNVGGVEGSVNKINSVFLSNLICRFLPARHRLGEVKAGGHSSSPCSSSVGMTKKTKWPGIFLWVVGCLLLVINFIAADYKLITFYWLLRAAQGIILIWLLTKINFSKIKLLGSFVVSMTLAAGLGIYQFLSQNALASKWLGLAMHTASQLGESVVEFGQERWLRAYGPLPHPNILAGFLLVAIIFCVWLINDLRQTTNDKRQKKPNLLLVVSCMLLIVSLFFSFSRAAWLVFGLLVVCWVVRLIRNKELKNDLFKLLVVCCLLLVILSIIYWPLVKTRLGAGEPQRLEVMSNQQRVVGYGEALGLIQDNLWLGVGLGNYTAALQSLRPDLAAWDYQPVHNVCVLVLTEVGLIGIILVLFLLFFYKKRYKDTKEIKRSSLFKSSPVLLYCFITILLLFFFDHFWWTLPSGLLLVFLLVGLLINRKTEDLI